jgi:pimeloyl-ACP methyl ester carboxylesterase
METRHLNHACRDDYGSGPAPRWVGVDWSPHLRRLTIDGRGVNVLDAGHGPVIVFVHGHNVSWQHWLEQIEVFRDTHRVIALDLPGFGHSELPRAPVSIEGYADTVAAVCAELQIDRAAVVGNSMGGLVAAELALRHPALVERLVLISPAGVSDRYMGFPAKLIGHPVGGAVARRMFAGGPPSERVVRALASRPRGRIATLAVLNARPVRRADRLHPAMVYELAGGFARPAAAAAAVALARHELRSRLPQIQAPTLIVWGDRDNLIPLRCGHEFQRLIPGARLSVYPDTGHNAMIERPARFNAELAAFLELGPGRGALLAAA